MDIRKKILLTGLGLLSISTKEAKKAFKAVAEKTPSKKKLEKTLNALIQEGLLQQKEAEKKSRELVKKILKELDIPTRSELKSLEKKLSNHNKS